MATDLASIRTAVNGVSTPQSATTARPATLESEAHHEQDHEQMGQRFANIVAVLMHDRGFKKLRLADLEWLVIPPVLSGQWRVAHSKVNLPGAKPETQTGADSAPERNLLMPVATVLWASVSSDIDKRLSDLDQKLLLRPDEWDTGDSLWLMATAGDRRAVQKILKELAKTEFKGRPVKLRANGPDGKVVVRTLDQSE